MRLARAQRLTGRATALGRAEARSAVRGRGVPGGSHVRPTRTTETGSRDDHADPGRHLAPDVSRLLGAAPATVEIARHPQKTTLGCARAIPECDHQPDWVAVGAVSSEPVSHVDKRIKDEYLKGPYYS